MYLALNFLVTRAIAALEWWLSAHMREAPAIDTGLVAAHV
jgi:octopine/nopaline transport system permease protein